jgi:hypothetical protein
VFQPKRQLDWSPEETSSGFNRLKLLHMGIGACSVGSSAVGAWVRFWSDWFNVMGNDGLYGINITCNIDRVGIKVLI